MAEPRFLYAVIVNPQMCYSRGVASVEVSGAPRAQDSILVEYRRAPLIPSPFFPFVLDHVSNTPYNRVRAVGWPVAAASLSRAGLPIQPLPIGLIVDTAFHSAIGFVLIRSSGFVRRKLRQRRGQCASCGYDMSGSDGTCPECGTEVAQAVE